MLILLLEILYLEAETFRHPRYLSLINLYRYKRILSLEKRTSSIETLIKSKTSLPLLNFNLYL